MNSSKLFKHVFLGFFIVSVTFTFFPIVFLNTTSQNEDIENQELSKNCQNSEYETGKLESSSPQDTITGTIEDREGKIYNSITTTNFNCYVNGEQPSLSDQPDIYIPDWELTYANMNFEDLKAINYTKDIETESSEFIYSSKFGPIYFYQKFSVRISQFVNNVSIFIQDINHPTEFTDENSWEVGIVNCTNDKIGTPNENETLGTLKKPHPTVYAAHWETFNFKDSGNGPTFLNISNTNWTIESGIKKYWFALKIKIPPDDTKTGGGPKFLYFSPDGENPNDKGEGDTFAVNPDFFTDKYYTNYVAENETLPDLGNYSYGNLTSFKYFDNDRYFVNSTYHVSLGLNIAIVEAKVYVEELEGYGVTFEDIADPTRRNEIDWWSQHYRYVNSINISFSANLSKNENFEYAYLLIENRTGGFEGLGLINQTNEDINTIFISDAWTKWYIINKYMNFSEGNSLTFRFQVYNDSTPNYFNMTINQLTVEIRELPRLNITVSYDPLIRETHYPNNVTVVNGTTSLSHNEAIESLNTIDEVRFEANASSNNASIEFEFNVLQGIDSSLFDVDDLQDWLFLQPNPIVPQIDIRITSNVSVVDSSNMSLSILEIYKGNNNVTHMSLEDNKSSWIAVDSRISNNSYAFSEETTNVTIIDPFATWTFMQLVNTSNNNLVRMRLRYVGNNTFEKFNITIDEFAFIIYVQNAISSDVTSKISFGLNSATLLPSDIIMQNFGSNISDNGYQRGLWSGVVSNGFPTQGSFSFNVSSIWPEITFNVVGTYLIEQDYNFEWEYELATSYEKVLWYVTGSFDFYDNNGQYNIPSTSRGFQVSVPNNWEMMELLNCTGTVCISDGGWSWTNYTSGMHDIINIYNISDGSWKAKFNSSISTMTISYNDTTNLKIDQEISESVLIPDYYGGDVRFEVLNSQEQVLYSDLTQLNASLSENSTSFSWNVFSTTQQPGVYYMKTYWSMYNDTHAFVSMTLREMNISLYPVKLEILNIDSYTNDTLQGTNIFIEGLLSYEETGEPIEGETVNIEIKDDKGNAIETLSDISNENGLIQVDYDLPAGYNSVFIGLSYGTNGTYYAATQSIETLTITLISPEQLFLNIFLMLLPYILPVVAGLTIALVLLRRHRSKLREKWADDALILDDLLKISYLMIIHKDVGVSIFDKQVGTSEFDPDLVGGFLQAISAFRSEIKRDEEAKEHKEEGFEMDYGDFKIILTDGNCVRTALISDGIPSLKLKHSQNNFTRAFEARFKEQVGKFDGDVTPYRDSEDLIERYFNTSLMYPLQLGKQTGVIKLNALEKVLVEVAEEIQKEKKFFFVSSLLSFGLAGRKESRDQIISAIISLKEKGVLEPINIE